MEVRTQPQLTAEEIRAELGQVMAWLTDWGFASVEVVYGFGCEESDCQWKAVSVATGDLATYLDRAERTGFFKYGNADVWIGAGAARFRLCHEADIHFASPHHESVETFKSQWLANGWTVYQGTGEPGCEWTKFP
ncbi:MAG TPA: hypothetical protein VMT15_00295 [Bryobacteraceae bacterium]|nr:hypothetical protein [Bryobacteraceae bacterium]